MVGLAVSPADRLHVAVQLRQRTAYRPLPETEGGERWSRAVNAGNILLNLTILGVFKYYDFFAASFAELFGIADYDSLLLRIILPVGISFYTFQALSYSIDVYRDTLYMILHIQLNSVLNQTFDLNIHLFQIQIDSLYFLVL